MRQPGQLAHSLTTTWLTASNLTHYAGERQASEFRAVGQHRTKQPRHSWQRWHRGRCAFCKLRASLIAQGFESHPRRHFEITCLACDSHFIGRRADVEGVVTVQVLPRAGAPMPGLISTAISGANAPTSMTSGRLRHRMTPACRFSISVWSTPIRASDLASRLRRVSSCQSGAKMTSTSVHYCTV